MGTRARGRGASRACYREATSLHGDARPTQGRPDGRPRARGVPARGDDDDPSALSAAVQPSALPVFRAVESETRSRGLPLRMSSRPVPTRCRAQPEKRTVSRRPRALGVPQALGADVAGRSGGGRVADDCDRRAQLRRRARGAASHDREHDHHRLFPRSLTRRPRAPHVDRHPRAQVPLQPQGAEARRLARTGAPGSAAPSRSPRTADGVEEPPESDLHRVRSSAVPNRLPRRVAVGRVAVAAGEPRADRDVTDTGRTRSRSRASSSTGCCLSRDAAAEPALLQGVLVAAAIPAGRPWLAPNEITGAVLRASAAVRSVELSRRRQRRPGGRPSLARRARRRCSPPFQAGTKTSVSPRSASGQLALRQSWSSTGR
jgi:hypothetical protein